MTFPPVSVLGVGLASPGGFTAQDHAFFVRAGLVQPVPSPFLNEDDEAIPCAYCPWLGADSALPERLERLALNAASEAIGDVAGAGVHLSLVTASPDEDFTDADAAVLSSRLKTYLNVRDVSRFLGAAGAHLALTDAAQRLGTGAARAVCIVGVDSLFTTRRVLRAYRRRQVVWIALEPPPSEAAAALLLGNTAEHPTRRPLATVLAATTTRGLSHDHNDEPVDGVGLTYLLRQLPDRGGVPMVFGPTESERLRRREWHFASARAKRHLGPPYAILDVESHIGQVGAAAGVVHLAYGVACNQYRSIDPNIPPRSPFYSWAISADGLRGAALLEGAVV